jgi:dihydropteroate synthase
MNSLHKNTSFSQKRSININGILLTFEKPLIMGILNVTPDSFFDGGRYSNESEIISHVKKMVDEGAAIIDIGAISTRPGAKPVSAEEEELKLISAIELVRKNFNSIIISADTYRAGIAEKAVKAGADIINDISGGLFDEKMFSTIAALHVPYILMHMQGNPENMQQNPYYSDVFKEVMYYFSERISKLRDAGVSDIILDPGFGFGKSVEHNYTLLQHLDKFSFFERPILTGFSRKSMINRVLNTKPENALNGTTVLNTLALIKGANILRVHDVKEAVEAAKIVEMLNNNS